MKFRLAFAIHNHQPVGNFSAVFEEAHTKCYLPFLELARKHPAVRFSLHQSGILWDWQKEHHQEFFSLVGQMVDAGQVELLSGAYYEPILPAIPDRDKAGQLNMLTTYLKKHFEVRAHGMWLAERVWEPHLPRVLNECGLHYLPLDDTHFKYAGLNDEQLYGTYLTEEAGKTVTLLPILQKLRYLIPFGTPEKVIEFLSQAAVQHPGAMAVYADDGEKFGSWPNTYKHCYIDGWLDRFFTLLEQNADWLEVIPLGDAVAQTKPLGRVYLPTASYSEMLHWALPADGFVAFEEFEHKLKAMNLYDTYSRFVRGGHWRGFLAKYPESNLMHKKMLAVSDLFDQTSRIPRVDRQELDKARDALYAGQCNCPYWHGVFGGLYLPHLRWAIYHKLIRAETILRRLTNQTVYATFEDRDCDGYGDIILGGTDLSIAISPGRGGQIYELDCLSNDSNAVDCLTRRREGYHRKLLDLKSGTAPGSTQSIHDLVLAKEEGLERLLVEDWYLRRPLADHFLVNGANIDDFMAGKYHELGDFILEPFDTAFVENDANYQVTMTRRGHVWHGSFHCPLRLEKVITFPKRGNIIDIRYRLIQHDIAAMPVTFAVEFDFNLLAPDAEDRYAVIDGVRPNNARLGVVAEAAPVSKIAYLDECQNVGLQLEADRAAKTWRMPIHTVSLSEGGFEKVFQGNCTLFLFEQTLAAGEEFSVGFRLYAGSLEKLAASGNPGRMTVGKA
jgi:hypothetical protein